MRGCPGVSLIVALIALPPLGAGARAKDLDRCPANAIVVETVNEKGTVVHNCACDAARGYLGYKGRCEHKVAIEDDLIQRIGHITKTIDSTTDTIAAERNLAVLAELKRQSATLLAAAGTSRLTRSPAAITGAALAMVANITIAVQSARACDGSENLRTACRNLETLQGELHRTAQSLVKLQSK